MSAGGQSLSAVRDLAAEAYVAVSLPPTLAPAIGPLLTLDKYQVMVTVAAYRPVYVTGAVADPREIAFRPGLTLRHVLALTSPPPAPGVQSPATTEEIGAAATGLAHEYARIWRLKSLLGSDTQADYDRILVPGASGVEDLVQIEQSIVEETVSGLKARIERLEMEQSLFEDRVSVLGRQRDNETDALAMDEQDLDNVRDLAMRGLAPAARLAAVRRAALATASRVLEIEVALENARAQVAKLGADIVQIDADARIATMTALGEALATVQERRADLATLRARSTTMPVTEREAMPRFATVLRDGVGIEGSESGPALKLMPGDIVEIRMAPDSPGKGSQGCEVQ